MNTAVDDLTAAYIAQVSPAFEDMRQVAAQLAGWLVLHRVGGGEGTAEHLLLKVARELLRCSREEIETQAPTPAARPHHEALRRAAAYLERAFPEGGRVETNMKAACRQLNRAARLLPGFSPIEFSHVY